MKHPTHPTRATAALALALLLAGCAGSSLKNKADKAVSQAKGARTVQDDPNTMQKYNDKGVLVVDMRLPEYYRTYWDDGTLKTELVGDLYEDKYGKISVKTGTERALFSDGRINATREWAYGEPVSAQAWNEKGVLTHDFRRSSFERKWYDDGTLKEECVCDIVINSEKRSSYFGNGTLKTYFPDGKPEVLLERSNGRQTVYRLWDREGYELIPDEDEPFVNPDKFKARIFRNGDAAARIEYADSGKVLELEHDSSGNIRLARLSKNGTPVQEMSGALIVITPSRPDIDEIKVYNGEGTLFFPNGQPQRRCEWEDGEIVSCKEWNEKGILIFERLGSTSLKKWHDDDKHGNENANMGNGAIKTYFPNGKPKEQLEQENGEIVVFKSWNEDGSPKLELSFPDSVKVFHPEPGISEFTKRGVLYRDGKGKLQLQDGTADVFSEDGKLLYHAIYENRFAKRVEKPERGEILELERDSSNNLRTARLLLNGTLVREKSGGLVEIERDDPDIDSIRVYNGEEKEFFEDGKPKKRIEWENGAKIFTRAWRENGKLRWEALPTSYKAYREDGTLDTEATGTIVFGGIGYRIKDGTLRTFNPDGKTVKRTVEYRDFVPVAK